MPFNVCCNKASRILEQILDDAITKKARAQAAEHANQYADEMRRESRLEGAWTHACCAWINGRRLALVQANRDLLESLLNPGEEPSAKLYIALAQQYPQRFAWSSPPTTQSDEERRADFALICRQNNLSECIANEKLHKSGIGIEHWAGASQVELQTVSSRRCRGSPKVACQRCKSHRAKDRS